jgi:sarcosine oxidase delta subunit
VLVDVPDIVATADSAILDRCRRWFNLARHTVAHGVPSARVVDLS